MAAEHVTGWLERYVPAWRANDPAQIGELFSADAMYFANPFDDGLRGREAIIQEWLGVQMPPDFRANYRAELVVGLRAFVAGHTDYFEPDGSVHSSYGNAFLLTFDQEGRRREYREWYAKAPEHLT